MNTRRQFIGGAILTGFAGCTTSSFFTETHGTHYAVSILGDTHFDAEPESVYHSHYDESNRWAKIQHAEFKRNGEMWRERCRTLLAASGACARQQRTDFVLQLGDLIQGDCDDVPTHQKMLADCIRLFRGAYPDKMPFLTVMGNHDDRGKGARKAYLDFAEPFMTDETKAPAKYPVFSFRHGPDRWIFCDFELRDLALLCDCLAADPDARHTFLVTHGPFTCPDSGGAARWRLAGDHACDAQRTRLYELLSRRHAIVLSGHTHTVACYRHANAFGGFSEFTANSVWKAPELATAEPICDDPAKYGQVYLDKMDEKKRADYQSDTAFFRPGLKAYFYNNAAGHFRLNVGPSTVTMDFYPGAATTPARTFDLTAGRC